MNPKDQENLYRLFRYHANVIGAARMTVMSIKAIINAVQGLKCNRDSLMKMFTELLEVVRISEPKIIPLIHLLIEFEKEIQEYIHIQDHEKLRKTIIRILTEKIDLYEFKANSVTHHGLGHVKDDDTIIVHSASSVVTNILVEAARVTRRKFKVIILQLDPVRTPQLVKSLDETDIDHIVVPIYNLCHHLDEANKIFIGALTITPDNKIIAPVGSSNVLGICHLNGIKSYLFANSLHYSHDIADNQLIHVEQSNIVKMNSSYCLQVYSHDLVDLKLMDVIISEEGLITFEKVNIKK